LNPPVLIQFAVFALTESFYSELLNFQLKQDEKALFSSSHDLNSSSLDL